MRFSFSASRNRGRTESSWGRLSGFIYFLTNFWRKGLWQVFLDAVRFNYFALDMLRPRTPSPPVGMPWPMDDTSDDDTNNPPPREPTIREYLDEQGYSRRFRVNYVFPLLCALWNVGNISDALNLPIKEFVRCLWDNDLLTIFPWMSKWATIANGNDFLGQINRIIPPDRLRLRTRVISVHSEITGLYIVRTRNGGSERREKFDRIIFALPGQEALRLLKPDANNREKQILGGFQSERVIGVLHTDRKVGYLYFPLLSSIFWQFHLHYEIFETVRYYMC